MTSDTHVEFKFETALRGVQVIRRNGRFILRGFDADDNEVAAVDMPEKWTREMREEIRRYPDPEEAR